MKKYVVKPIIWAIGTLLLVANQVTALYARGLDIDVDIEKHQEHWYNQPWAWIVGAAIFILLLVAIVRSGGRASDSD